MSFAMGMSWHDGEKKMHELMRVPNTDNPSAPALTQQASWMLQRAPLIALGALDDQKRPWSTLWGGQPPLSQPLGQSLIGIKCPVEKTYDPVVKSLFGEKTDGEVVQEQDGGKMVSGLAIELDTRKRVKLYGRLAAGAVSEVEGEEGDEAGQVQMVIRVDQSLGNCPKYLNRKQIRAGKTTPKLISDSAELSAEAVELISKADLFFVSSSNSEHDMDTNHRGGPPGFTRTRKTEAGDWEIIWPEYSGNRLYQTLGNLQVTPRAGLVFPNFETGDVLYVTGETEVLVGKDAAAVIPRSNLAVKVRVTASKYVQTGLSFRGDPGEPSPYNPKVRPLVDEQGAVDMTQAESDQANTATLLSREDITPTISRFRFKLNNPATWQAGSWVALDFSSEFDFGYTHMCDEDPRSINDDFVRTFTVSSPPAPKDEAPGSSVPDDQFEITIRKVGLATEFLAKQDPREHYELPVKGFGGEFRVDLDKDEEALTGYVVGGVGITPLLAQLPYMDIRKMKIFWTLHQDDLGLVVDITERHKELREVLSLYITGASNGVSDANQANINMLKNAGVNVQVRRLTEEDLQVAGLSNRWYMCVSTRLKGSILQWLTGKEVVFESFDY